MEEIVYVRSRGEARKIRRTPGLVGDADGLDLVLGDIRKGDAIISGGSDTPKFPQASPIAG